MNLNDLNDIHVFLSFAHNDGNYRLHFLVTSLSQASYDNDVNILR